MTMEAVGLQREHVPQHATVSVSAAVLIDGDAPADDSQLPALGDVTCHISRADVVDDDLPGGALSLDGNVYTAELNLAAIAHDPDPVDLPLGEVTITWTFGTDGPGAMTQVLDVVGRRVCTLGDLNQVLDRAGNANTYGLLARRVALQLAVDAFEKEAGLQVFTMRETTEVVYHDGGPELVLNHCDVATVEAIVLPDGSTGDVAGLMAVDDAILSPTGWRCGAHKVTYTHGPATSPVYVTRAIALIASSTLADGPWDDRGFAVDDGTGLMRLLTAGVSGASFSIPEVQAALNRVRDIWVG